MINAAAAVNPDPLVAIVANSDIAYGLSRMYEALLSGTDWDVRVFRTRPEAVQWIREKAQEKFALGGLSFS